MLDSLQGAAPPDQVRNQTPAQAHRTDAAPVADLIDPHLARLYNRFSSQAAALVILIGLGTLLLWLLGISRLSSIRPSWIALMPNSALAFITLAVALLLSAGRTVGHRLRAPVVAVCCALALIIAAASLFEDIVGLNLGIDQLLFRDVTATIATHHPGRPGPVTSVLLILLALALLATIPRFVTLITLCSIPALLAAMTLMIAYALNASEMYTLGNTATPTSFIAALASLLLAAGIICQDPWHPLFRQLASGGAGGLMLRNVLPLVVVTNTVVAGLRLWTQSEGLFKTDEFGAAAVATTASLCMVAIFIVYAKQMDRLEVARRIAETRERQLKQLLQQKLADLEEVNHELEEFSYSVSHDLRTPLRAIDGFSAILAEDYADRLDPEGQRVIGVVRDGTRKMAQLIDDILAFSRIGRAEMSTANVNMNGLIDELLPEFAGPMSGRDIRITVPSLPPAQGDRMMLRRVWQNLLDNAIKYTGGKDCARIELGSISGDNELVYWIKDNGAGFDMRYADKLFGMFRRLHGVEEFSGTGIGLAIVKRIVTRHGGRVWAEGEPDHGATVSFALPIRKESNV